MGRNKMPAAEKRTILIPLRVNAAEYAEAAAAAEASHVPTTVIARIGLFREIERRKKPRK